MSRDHGVAVSPAVQAAIEGGRVASFDPTGNDAIDALLACAEATGIALSRERIAAAVRLRPTGAQIAARALGLPIRRVDLSADPAWWRGDAEALVVRERGRRCAVVHERGRAILVRPDGSSTRIDAAVARAIDPSAIAVIPAFHDGPATLRDARRLGWTGGGARDLALIIALGLASMVIGTLVPVASGLIVGELVPTGEVASIWLLTLVLVCAAGVAAIVVAAQAIIAQRLTGRFALRLTQASFERLFRLRTSFHREHLPGELSQRVLGLEAFRATVAASLPGIVSSIALVAASVIVLSRLSGALAIAVLAVSALAVVAGLLALPALSRHARAHTERSVELGGLTFTLLGGIAKLRTAGAESRMLERWTLRFARQQASARDLGRITLALAAIASLPAALMPVLLVLGEVTGLARLAIGPFTAATTASAQAAGAIAGLLPIAVGLVTVAPTVRALEPILSAAPEPRGSAATDPGALRGDLRLDAVTFGYDRETPILHDLNLEVLAGTMTAIVGPSGSGKSTIVRLLLGLEQPTAGQVLIDGRSLAGLDRAAVLAQMGIVPQEAALVPGSILDNILAAAPELAEEAAWSAAERAGIADDIRAMPMGMHTVVTEGASSFSGGQRQRIMLARALVRDPRIVVLDEATSALDNRAQEQVAAAIDALGATRIVIAHRLSTIERADRIVVLDGGRVTEDGTFAELMARGGTFARLAARQRDPQDPSSPAGPPGG